MTWGGRTGLMNTWQYGKKPGKTDQILETGFLGGETQEPRSRP